MDKIKIIDNFLKHPDLIRNIALTSLYYSPTIVDNWLGFRTELRNYTTDDDIKNVLNKILLASSKIFSIDEKNYQIFWAFHYSPKISQILVRDYFYDFNLHKDIFSDYAGVIYLNPSPPKNTGTSFKNNNKDYNIENVYNRIIIYDSAILHGPTSFFGDTIDNGRLCLVFFLKPIFLPKTNTNYEYLFNN